ncbi:MAG: Hpt domain-containing protein [Phycisphaeraceae bacterium]
MSESGEQIVRNRVAGCPPAVLRSEVYEDEATRSLVEQFIADLPGRLAAMDGAWRRGEMAHLSHLAMLLKGAAGGFGYPDMAQAAEELSRAAIGGEPIVQARCAIHRLASLYEAALRGIEWNGR